MKEKIVLDDGDIAVLELLDDLVWFGSFIRSTSDDDEYGKDWEFDNYQKVVLNDQSNYIVACTGRATGKTIILETKIIHRAATNFYKGSSENEILFVVQNKAQLEPVFLRITKFFRTHEFLRYFIDRTSINFSQHEIKLLNGAMIRCRIIGSTADANIIGMHTPCVFVDEAQVLSYTAWNSLQQTINTWDEGFHLWVSGVPNGLREKNVLFECDQVDEQFSKHNVSRIQSPRYTKAQNKKDLKQYGGESGDDYVHLVLGQHGSPAFSVFDRKLMRIGDYQVYVSTMNDLSLQQAGGRFNELLYAPEAPPNDLIMAGIDAGFSNEPTIITVLYYHEKMWRELLRYELRRIKYPQQARIIQWLDAIYRFNMVALDAGSSGLALSHILQEQDESLAERLVPVDFQGSVIVGYDEEEKEVKQRVRPFTIQQLQNWSQNDQIIEFSTQDEDVILELERVGFTRDLLGQPKYFVYSPQGGQKGEDHILASILTWVYGYYCKHYSPEKPQSKGRYSDLAEGGWLIP